MLHWLHNCMTIYEDMAVPHTKQNVTTAGAEAVFFLGWGAPLRNGVTDW